MPRPFPRPTWERSFSAAACSSLSFPRASTSSFSAPACGQEGVQTAPAAAARPQGGGGDSEARACGRAGHGAGGARCACGRAAASPRGGFQEQGLLRIR
jgi:hypothetical protein